MNLPKQAVPVERNARLTNPRSAQSRSGVFPAVMVEGLSLKTGTFTNNAEQVIGQELFSNCGPVGLSNCVASPNSTNLICRADVPCKSITSLVFGGGKVNLP
jgi:hypothetical protein